MKNKKGMALYYVIVTGFVIGLVVFYLASIMEQPKYPTDYVGQLSLNMLQTIKSVDRTPITAL